LRAGCLLAVSFSLACATATAPRKPASQVVAPPPPEKPPAPAEPEAVCAPLPPPPAPLPPLREFTPREWTRIRRAQRYVHVAARRHELSPALINGMIWVESKFEARARGRRGPRGVLQLMPKTGRLMAKRLQRRYMPHSIDFSVAAGTEYLMLMLEQFDGDLELALAAYNAGPRVVVAQLGAPCPAPKPRQAYVAHVRRAALAFCERLPRRYEPKHSTVFTCPPATERPGGNMVARAAADEAQAIASR
jgi:hypothetical protein